MDGQTVLWKEEEWISEANLVFSSQNWKKVVVQSASDYSVHLETKTEDSSMAFPEVTQNVSPGTARKVLSPCAWFVVIVRAVSIRREFNLDSCCFKKCCEYASHRSMSLG